MPSGELSGVFYPGPPSLDDGLFCLAQEGSLCPDIGKKHEEAEPELPPLDSAGLSGQLWGHGETQSFLESFC